MGDVETVGGAVKQFMPILAPGDCGEGEGGGLVRGQVIGVLYSGTIRHVDRI